MAVQQDPELPVSQQSSLENHPVAFISRIIEDIISQHINVPLSPEQLETAEITARYIEPAIFEIEKKFLDESVLYNLLASYLYFQTSSESGSPSNRRLMETRMQVTVRIARHIVHDMEHLFLARALMYEFYPLNQGNEQAMLVPKYLRVSALELAVKTEAKPFLMEPPVFSVVNDLWNGVLVVEQRIDTSLSPRLRHAVTDLHRSKHNSSPKFKHIVQLISAMVFLILYLALIQQDPQSPNLLLEFLFGLWSCGYALDEYNQLREFGYTMYFMSLWNTIDVILVIHSLLYGCIRFVSAALPNVFPRSVLFARGILITAGLFVVPRLFSVFDNNKVFSNMVFSLRKVSADFLVSWFVVMMFSVGVWVSVAFSVPRVRLSSIEGMTPSTKSGNDNGGTRTALAMFKMLFDDTGDLWDNWFEYTTFDKIALSFYLILAQFVMPTVVTAVVASSFASIRENSEEAFYYMRAVQCLQKIKSHKVQRASTQAVSPLNFLAWLFEWSEYVLPKSIYRLVAVPTTYVFSLPGKLSASLGSMYDIRQSNRARKREQKKKKRLQTEVERSLGNPESEDARGKRSFAGEERRETKFALVNEVFTNEKVLKALNEHPEWEFDSDAVAQRGENSKYNKRLADIEATLARIESLLVEGRRSTDPESMKI